MLAEPSGLARDPFEARPERSATMGKLPCCARATHSPTATSRASNSGMPRSRQAISKSTRDWKAPCRVLHESANHFVHARATVSTLSIPGWPKRDHAAASQRRKALRVSPSESRSEVSRARGSAAAPPWGVWLALARSHKRNRAGSGTSRSSGGAGSALLCEPAETSAGPELHGRQLWLPGLPGNTAQASREPVFGRCFPPERGLWRKRWKADAETGRQARFGPLWKRGSTM
mmetsp:Transcript_76201/g.211808  ORF Transcript_76201/g.211808 Transcript_76201/m.211808 type:complete len:232 (+) Transcript_76201:1070-1765(+)